MCLILLAYNAHQRYKLLVAANRDEFHARPATPLGFWPDQPHLLAGRDLQAGGTWFGVSRAGRFAALTNYREPSSAQKPKDAPSRGHFVRDFLSTPQSAQAWLASLAACAGAYHGFNLLLSDATGLYAYSNRAAGTVVVPPGVHGLSNHVLNTPWPKLERGKRALHQLLSQQRLEPEQVLELLLDRTPAPDAALPATGVPLLWERWLSPIFIAEAPGYGTRASTVLLVEHSGLVRLLEVTWNPAGQQAGIQQFSLYWPASAG